MSEKLFGIPRTKIDLMLEGSSLPPGAISIVWGYLSKLSESKNQTLEEIHSDYLSNLTPGVDYEEYQNLFDLTFNFIKTNARKLGISQKRLK